jgi:hypothetical protein
MPAGMWLKSIAATLGGYDEPEDRQRLAEPLSKGYALRYFLREVQ